MKLTKGNGFFFCSGLILCQNWLGLKIECLSQHQQININKMKLKTEILFQKIIPWVV